MSLDPSQQLDPTAETQSFLSTEFFFYILPCYLALASFTVRYITIMKQEPTHNIQQLPGEFVVTCFQEQYDIDQETQIPPPSYVVKSKLSLFNSYMYLLMTSLGILGDPDMFYAASHRTYSLLYLFGFLAWSYSAVILRRQYQRGISQSLWTHRFFWMFAGVFSVTKMFEDYLLPLNLILNSLFIANNTILVLYALYRPEDKPNNLIQFEDEVPTFARLFFQKLELNPYVRKYLKISDPTVMVDSEDTLATAGQGLTPEQLQTFQKALAQKQTSNPQQQIKLFNQLPRRNIIVNKKAVVKKINNAIKYYFLLITQIGSDGNFHRFEAERKYIEFVQLETSLAVHFSEKNFPKLKLPKLNKTQFISIPDSVESERRSDILQQWIQQILATPIFIISPVLKFLNVDEENSAPFLTYYNTSFRSFCSNTFLSTAFREHRNIQIKQQRVSLWNPIDEEHQHEHQEADDARKRLISAKLQFEVIADPVSIKTNLFRFDMTCRPPRHSPLRWAISKTEEQFAILNEKIQEEVGYAVPFYYKNLIRIPESMKRDTKCNQIKLSAYENYLRNLLETPEYYTFALFEFLSFDPLKLQVIEKAGGGSSGVLNNRFSLTYKNTYISEIFPETRKPLEILEVSMEQVEMHDTQHPVQYQYRFKIKRWDNDIKKDHKQLRNLRNKLLHIYRGISSIPELPNFDVKITKSELPRIKMVVEGFLEAVDGLQQIEENPSYMDFYGTRQKVLPTQDNSPIKMILNSADSPVKSVIITPAGSSEV